MAPAYRRKRSGREYFARTVAQAGLVDRPAEGVVHPGVDRDHPFRRHPEILHDMLSGDLGDGDDRVRAGGVARYQEPVTQTIHEPGRPGHHVPVETVADPDRRAGRPKRDGILGIEEQVDAVPPHRLGNGDLIPAEKRPGGQGDLLDLWLPGISADQAGVPVEQDELVSAAELE